MEHVTHRCEGFAGHQMRWRGIAQKRIKHHGVILPFGFIEKLATVPDGQLQSIRFAAKELLGHGDHGRVDLHDIDASAVAGQVHRHNADAHADAERVIDLGRVTLSQSMQHIAEEGQALFGGRVVGVLNQVIVEIKAPPTAVGLNDLEPSEIGIAPEQQIVIGKSRPQILTHPGIADTGAKRHAEESGYPRRFV